MNLSSASVALAHKNELLLFFTLLELALIVLAGRFGGAIASRVGQSPAVGEIIIGILLGPSLFGWIAPHTFDFIFHSASPQPLLILSQLGLVLLMFQIGLEFDFAHLTERGNRAAVARVSIACLALPFASGFALSFFLAPHPGQPDARIKTALFVATAFSITALPILGRIMIEFDLTRTRLGVIAISAAAINDVVGWLLLALITALTVSNFVGSEFAMRVALVAAFAFVSAKLVRPLLKGAIRRSNPRGGMSGNLLGGLLAVIFIAAMTTYQIGIFAIFGGFMMGVILFDEAELVAAWRTQVGAFVTVFFLPIFFTYTGLRTSIGGLDTLADWGSCLAIVAAACGSKLCGAYLGARRSGFGHEEAAMIGFMMNTRALMELIVINVGFDLGVVSQKMFTMLVIMAIVSTVATTPALRYYLNKTYAKTAGAAPSVPSS